jgi:hypothetical protein
LARLREPEEEKEEDDEDDELDLCRFVLQTP